MSGMHEHCVNASRANLQASLNLATKSVEDSAQLVRHQLKVAMTMTEEGAGILEGVSSHDVDPVAGLAEHHGVCERQLRKILDLSCRCLEVTARTHTELVRLIQDNFQNMSEALAVAPAAPAGNDAGSSAPAVKHT
jgi:bacterioferritin-associated ferredoxin